MGVGRAEAGQRRVDGVARYLLIVVPRVELEKGEGHAQLRVRRDAREGLLRVRRGSADAPASAEAAVPAEHAD